MWGCATRERGALREVDNGGGKPGKPLQQGRGPRAPRSAVRREGEAADCVACCSGRGAGEGTRGKEDPTMKRGAAEGEEP